MSGGGKRLALFHKCFEGFTLAEVLITLGIIGVVAALTLPNLIANYRDKVLIAQTKRTYSLIMNAITLWKTDVGSFDDNTLLFNPSQSSLETAKNFAKYFNAPKICENQSIADCSKYYITYKYSYSSLLNGVTYGEKPTYPLLMLNDGAKIYIRQSSSCFNTWVSCERDENGFCKKDESGNDIMKPGSDDACGYIYFDVNGEKGPNQFGRDAYLLKVRTNDIVLNPWKPSGYESLRNILSGKDKLIYTNYNIGDKVD